MRGKELQAHFLWRPSALALAQDSKSWCLMPIVQYPLTNTEECVTIFLSSHLSKNSQSGSFLTYFPYKGSCRWQSLC